MYFINRCYPVDLPPDSTLSRVRTEAERDFILPWELTYILQKSNNMSSWVMLNMISQESIHLFVMSRDPSAGIQLLTQHFAIASCIAGDKSCLLQHLTYPLSQMGKTTFTSPEQKRYLASDLISCFKLTFSSRLAFQFSISLSSNLLQNLRINIMTHRCFPWSKTSSEVY